MRGGFTGALSSPVLGQPWLTGVRPFWIKPNGNPDLTLHGSELWLGPTPVITIGGVPAGVVARTVDQMVITPPALTVPGFQPVVTTTAPAAPCCPRASACCRCSSGASR